MVAISVYVPTSHKTSYLRDMMGHGITALKESFAIKGFEWLFITESPQNVLSTLNTALCEQRLCKSSLVTIIINVL